MASDNTIVVGFETEGVQMTMDALKALRSQSEKMEKAETQAYIEQSKRNAKALEDLRKMQAEHRANLDASIKYSGGFAGGLNRIADDIKRVGKDLDNVSGKGAKDFAMMTEGALSVVAAIGTGGVAGAIGLATLAIGTIVGKWQESEKAAEEAAKKAGDAAKAHADLIKELATGILAGQKQLDMNMVLQREAEIQARRLMMLQKSGEIANAYLFAQQQKLGSDARNEAFTAIKTMRADMAKELAAIEADASKVAKDKNKLLTRETNKWEVDEWKDKEDKKKNITNDANADYARSMKVITAAIEKQKHDESAKFKAGYDKNLAEFKSFESEVSHINSEGIKLRAEKHGEWVEEYIRMLNVAANEEDKINKAALKARAEAFRDGKLDEEKKALEATKKASDAAAAAKKKHTEEILKQNKAIREHTTAVYTNSAAQVANDVVTWSVMPGIDLLTEKTEALGKVNRDNFWELYDFTKMTPELVAAKVQAILAGVAKEAAVKSIFEYGEALKEGAGGLGSLAIGDAAGASMHFASASAHVAAAGAYGMIGGMALTGAVAIGATRGATAEEREKKRSERGDGMGSMSSGSTMGRGDGMGGGGFSVTVVNNAPLIVPPSDQNRAGRAVARAVSRANRDAFARREMGQR